jgi:phosphate starvation-inducible protein PhoH/intein/homing endonuclease
MTRSRAQRKSRQQANIPLNKKKQQSPLVTLDNLVELQPLTKNQERLFDAYDDGKNIVAHGYPGTGKAQPLYSKILTPNGWVLMGELKVGDEVIVPKGEISTVTGIFPQGDKEIYEIVFHDGSKTRACGEHLWDCYFPRDKNYRHGSDKKLVTTLEIIEHLDYQKNKKSKDYVNISIDLITPRETKDIELPLNPYLLGVIIGDGSVVNLPVMISNADDELLEKVSNILNEDFNGCNLNKIKSNKYNYSISIDSSITKLNPVSHIIRELNLYGKKSYEKEIPQIYMDSGINQKLMLLQGLLDTDGTVGSTSSNGNVSFTSTSHKLAQQVQELVWSIGGLATITQRIPTFNHKGEKKQGRVAYTIHIKTRDNKKLFYISRKKDRCKDTYDSLQYRRRIKEINYIGVEPAQCIMIDDVDHLYITDDYIVTHNTICLLYKALEDVLDPKTPYKKVIMVRSTVATRDIGFLKGSVEEKISEFEKPYKYMIKNLFDFDSDEQYELLYGNLKAQKIFYFMSTSFIRGMTFDECIMIVDEFSNLSSHELDSIITRVGIDCKIHFSGDLEQSDLTKASEKSGAATFLRILNEMEAFERIDFDVDDIVRSDLVKEYIVAKHNLGLFSFQS